MKRTKKSLLASGASLLLSAALLVGSTFAWFTDSVTNTGNTIEAGKLDVNVIGYRLEDGNWGNVAWENNLKSNPLFTEKTWEPGQYGAILLRVSNYDSTLAAKVDIDFTIKDSTNNLADALWYRLEAVQTSDASHQNAMLEKLQFKNSRPASEADGVTTMSKIEEDPTDPVTIYPDYYDGQYVYYLLEYGMYTSADNQYQNGSIEVDFSVKATQATVEKDGFGNSNYDEDAYFADFSVNTVDELNSALDQAEPGDVIALSSDMVVDQKIVVPSGVEINGNGATFNTSVAQNTAFDIPNGTTDVIIRNCKIAGTTSASNASERPMGIAIRPGAGNVTIEDCTFVGTANQLGHAIWIDGNNSGSVTIRNCTIPRPINLSGYNGTVKDILIENNTFTNTWGVQALTLSGSLHNVTIRNNSLTGFGGLARIHKDGAVNFDFKNVVVEGNGTNSITVDPEVQEMYAAAVANGDMIVK